jgi:hypothetical protein
MAAGLELPVDEQALEISGIPSKIDVRGRLIRGFKCLQLVFMDGRN